MGNENYNPEPSPEALRQKSVAPSLTDQVGAAEAREQEPQLTLTVAGPCHTAEGRYVGLSKQQRAGLKVEVGGGVELFENGYSLGLFTVGRGATALLNNPTQFTVNDVDPNSTITLRKAIEGGETLLRLPVVRGIKNDPKTSGRQEKIAQRFEGWDIEVFMSLPTATLNQLLGTTDRVASISKAKIRYGGQEQEMVMVPSGNEFGFTTKAAQTLG